MRSDFWQFHPLLRVAALLVAGMVFGDALPFLRSPGVWMTLALAATLAGMVWLRRKWISSAAMLCAVFFFGAGWMLNDEQRPSHVPYDETTVCRTVVVSRPVRQGRVARADLYVILPNGQQLKAKAAFLCDGDERWRSLRVGDGVQAECRLERPANYYANAHFDYVRWLRSQGFTATALLLPHSWRPCAVDISGVSHIDRARWKLMRWRALLSQRLQTLASGHGHESVLAAMALGDKSGLPKATKDAYSIAGASHILALSGLHLSIIYGMLLLLLPGGRRRRWLSQLVALTAIWMYALLVGMAPSVVRSATMLTVFGVMCVADRERVPANVLALAAIIMLVAHPSTLWDIGFQMSFLAVLAISLCYGEFYGLWQPRWRVARWAWGMVVVSVVAQMGTAPLAMYYFGRFSCYFLLTNFIVVPLATLILYGAAALLLLGWWPWMAHVLGRGLHLLSWLMDRGVTAVGALPGASIENIHVGVWQVVALYAVMGCLVGFFFKWRHITSHFVDVADPTPAGERRSLL